MLLNQQGQTVVEYILLLSVAMSLVVTFYKSDTFQKLFGKQGSVGKLYKLEGEWGYRHALLKGRKAGEPRGRYNSAEDHPSYYSGSDTRFFGPSDPYE